MTASRPLLLCGVVAGPLFATVAGMQILTRDGFSLRHQPLSLGDLGWVQISNFILTGLLTVAFAIGVRRRLGETACWGRAWWG